MTQEFLLKHLTRKQFFKYGLISAFALKCSSAFSKEEKPQKNNLHLNGERKKINKKLVIKNDGSIIGPGTIELTSRDAYIELAGENITIRDVHFIAAGGVEGQSTIFKITEGSKNIKIIANHFQGDRYTILKADKNTTSDKALNFKMPVENVQFDNNTCAGSFSRHLYLHHINHLSICHNIFYNSNRDSIRLRQKIKKAIISHNHFKNIGQISSESSDAIDTYWSGEQLIIQGNIFSSIATHALDIKGISPDTSSLSSHVIIDSNIIEECQFSGLLLSSGSIHENKKNVVTRFTISNNQIRKCNLNNKNPNDAPIFIRHGVQDVIINANHIYDSQAHCIVCANFEQKSFQTSKIIISNNSLKTIRKTDHCILTVGVKDIIISQNLTEGVEGSVIIKRQKDYKNFKGSNYLEINNLNIVTNNNT